MCEVTYDIIDWKSCESGSELGSSPRNSYDSNGNDPDIVPKASGGSNSDHIVFPTLFYEDETETSIVTLPDGESDCWRSGTHEGVVPDDIEQLSVYQKVANWVSTQKGFFRKDEELVIEDDDLAVIDPVDLFQRSILDEYLLIAEDDLERRAILRDLTEIRCDADSINSKSFRPTYDVDVDRRQKDIPDDHRYDIESVHELMQAHEYKFIREPKGDVELELEQINEFGNSEVIPKPSRRRFRKKKISTCSTALDPEGMEEKILFLGVPRLLENYVVLNREGYDVKLDKIPDLWLSPFEEDLPKSTAEPDEANMSELEFLSSWFSDVNRTDVNTVERRQTVTDMLEKLTVITVGSDDEVWQDVPEIPHWLDEEQEELELFNQPSRPLYYYRDRIKGCYRIIGVEDETVVLFSGNDDDTIFYTEEDSFNPILNSCDDGNSVSTDGMIKKLMHSGTPYEPTPSFVSRYRRIYNRLRYGIKLEEVVNDAKNDSGIDEDIDENACDELQVSPYALLGENESVTSLSNSPKRPSFAININPKKESFIECLFVVMGAIIVLITLVLYKNDSPSFQMYRSKITEEVFDDIGLMVSQVFK